MNNSFFTRKYVIQAIFIAAALIVVARLFYIQIIDDKYILSANNNVLRKEIIFPARGAILDRNGEVLVQNEPVYDLLVTPHEVKNIDTLLLCQLIGIDKKGFISRIKKARAHSAYKASIFEKQLSAVTYARLQEYLYQFRGFYTQNRTVRSYPDSIAAQFLGYVQEVNKKDIAQSNGFYRAGDYIGATGVERSYEELLRGKRGIKNLMVDVHNRPQGSFMEGKYDTLAVTGDGLVSSLDRELQILAEQLMKNKRGSVVAIEPSTGEILAMVSSPTYDPNMMVGREVGNNYMKLINDINNPMFVRPIQASYPPGSVFKVVSALTAQQAGLINTGTTFVCNGAYRYGNASMACTGVHGTVDLVRSIQVSCNPYYANVYARMIDGRKLPSYQAYDLWTEALGKFGLGQPLGIDLPGEKGGTIKKADYFTKKYKSNKWRSGFSISQSIGQGELGITPLQMANIMAIVANRGFYYRPHLIKAIGNKKIIKPEFTEKIFAGVDQPYYEPVIEGMSRVVNQGGSARASKIEGIEMCGKTGTVQNSRASHHSVFFAFAPRENPKIAIAVFVENGGYGGEISAPIASMLVEKYINDTITLPKHLQDRVYNRNLLDVTAQSNAKIKNNTVKTSPAVQKTENKSALFVHHSQIRRRND